MKLEIASLRRLTSSLIAVSISPLMMISYTKALGRAMEAEGGAGKLENALAIKAEMEAFDAQAGFDKAAFEKWISYPVGKNS